MKWHSSSSSMASFGKRLLRLPSWRLLLSVLLLQSFSSWRTPRHPTRTSHSDNFFGGGGRFLLVGAAAATTRITSSSSYTTMVRYDCAPCLDRSDYKIQVLVHGAEDDVFWQQLHAAAVQSARDLDITLDFTLVPTSSSSSYNPNALATQIRLLTAAAANSPNDRPDVLIVSVPDDNVAAAVAQAVQSGIPVLGVNTGVAAGKAVGVLDFVASDDFQAGIEAAHELTRQFNSTTSTSSTTGSSTSTKIRQALFVNDELGNMANEFRLAAFRTTLGTHVVVQEMAVDPSDNNDDDMVQRFSSELRNCPYQIILLSSAKSLPAMITAYETAGCSIHGDPITNNNGNNNNKTPLGVFGTTPVVFDAIKQNQVSVALGEQQALQGALVTHLAGLYATTGKSLAKPARGVGAYLTGPQIITKPTLPTDTQQQCEMDAWPICPNRFSADGTTIATCDCTDRHSLKIAGVHHGVRSDPFWDPVYAASAQAAADLNVQLINVRPEPQTNETVLHLQMAQQIRQLCELEQVHGLFVSIPSDIVVPAIQTCLDLHIPVISINAGAALSQSLGLLHHIGMIEYNAGYGAGQYLASTGEMKKGGGICLNHAPGLNVLEERCNGFRDALQQNGIEYWGQVSVPTNNEELYIETVEAFVQNKTSQNAPNNDDDNDDSWKGIGLLVGGSSQHALVVALQGRHLNVQIGVFDTSDVLYEALELQIKEFGVDQQPYLQGYMPVLLLTHIVGTGQKVTNQVIESGPAYITTAPTKQQAFCEEKAFAACLPGVDPEDDDNDDSTRNKTPAPVDDNPSLSSSSSSKQSNRNGRIFAIGLGIVAMILFVAVIVLTCRINNLNTSLVHTMHEQEQMEAYDQNNNSNKAVEEPSKDKPPQEQEQPVQQPQQQEPPPPEMAGQQRKVPSARFLTVE